MIFCEKRRPGKMGQKINLNKGYKMSDRKEILSKIKKIVSEKLSVDESKVEESASFANDLGADSLDVVEFVMEVEKEFNITIPDEEATKLTTVGAAIDYIEAHAK